MSEKDPPPPARATRWLRPGVREPAWRDWARGELDQLRSDLDFVRGESLTAIRLRDRLADVGRLLRTGRGTYTEVRAALFAASEDLLLVLPDDHIRARVPGLRAALKAHLTADDPRYDEFTRLLDRVTNATDAPPERSATS